MCTYSGRGDSGMRTAGVEKTLLVHKKVKKGCVSWGERWSASLLVFVVTEDNYKYRKTNPNEVLQAARRRGSEAKITRGEMRR